MKKLLIITFIAAFAFTLSAQDSTFSKRNNSEMKTLLGSDITHGAYGAITIGYSQIDNEDSWLIGGRAAWILNHSVGIGFAGYGFANDIYLDEINNDKEAYDLVGGYGGLLIEPIFFSRELVHLTMPIIVGAGGVTEAPHNYWEQEDYWDNKTYEASGFFVLEPGLEIELNLTRFMRVSGGASYRLASEIDIPNVDQNALNGFSTYFSLKFGKF